MNRRINNLVFIEDDDWGTISCLVKNIRSEQERLKKLNSKIDNSYPSAVYFDRDKGRYVRLYRDKERSRFIKHKNNKKVRRYKGDIRNGNHYRKLSEFWWEYC